MNDLSVIILTFNEEIHIERCINSLLPVTNKIFIVDSYSTDRTLDIVDTHGATVVQRKFINQAEQFQWAIDNLPFKSEWIMRLDADEYIEHSLQDEIKRKLVVLPNNVDGVYLNRKHIFYEKWIKYGGRYPLKMLRIWRHGKGRVEQRWMDEHILLPEGAKCVNFKGGFFDANLKGISFFIDKHNLYATREAVDILNNKYGLFTKDDSINMSNNHQAKLKRFLKNSIYSKLPIGFRAAFYFSFRYFLQLGFLDGSKGFVYHFMQGFWYRLLVDIKVYEIERVCKGDIVFMKKLLNKEYGIDLR